MDDRDGWDESDGGWAEPGEGGIPVQGSGSPTTRCSLASTATGVTAAPPPTADEVSGHFAAHLAETSGSAFMYFSMAGVFRQTDAVAFKKYRDKLLADCGAPTDPIEVMMVEDLALAHLNTGRLHYRAATADSLEAARVYGSMAILLMGEFRRGALALKAYRTRPAASEARPHSAAAVGPGAAAPDEGVVGELGSNSEGDEHGERTIPLPEPAEGRGRPAEPGEATRPKRRRA